VTGFGLVQVIKSSNLTGTMDVHASIS